MPAKARSKKKNELAESFQNFTPYKPKRGEE
jgi:hypothetical protein